MLSRRLFLAAALMTAQSAFAGENIDYSAGAFTAAQKAGRAILVEVQAPWCPTCRAQKPILSQLESQAKFKSLLVVHVDFDSQKDALRRLGANQQSTLIVFKGAAEAARSVGETDPGAIEALLEKSL